MVPNLFIPLLLQVHFAVDSQHAQGQLHLLAHLVAEIIQEQRIHHNNPRQSQTQPTVKYMAHWFYIYNLIA